MVHIDSDKYGNYIFLDEDFALKYCSVVTHLIKTIDYLDFVEKDRPSLKFNQLKDRFLVLAGLRSVKEFSVSSSVISLVNEISEEADVADFAYFHKKAKKAEGMEIMVMTVDGVLRRLNPQSGQSRRFEISRGSRS